VQLQVINLCGIFRAKYYHFKKRLAFRKSKEEAWRSFVDKSRPWGRPYKVITKSKTPHSTAIPQILKTDGTLTTSDEEACQILLDAKFPSAPHSLLVYYPPAKPNNNIQYIDDHEITQILKKCKNKSAPGTDNINYKTMKIVNMKHPGLLPWIFNNCMRWAIFLKCWKEGRAVMLRKGKKSAEDVGEYRPLTMLSVPGKLLEKCIAGRIEGCTKNQLSAKQYGFRAKRSCEDCIIAATRELQQMNTNAKITAAVALDISGAFDHVLWPYILKLLQALHVPEYLRYIIKSYFTHRKITYGQIMKILQRGTPQGSVIGPLLWNLSYNAVLARLASRWVSHYTALLTIPYSSLLMMMHQRWRNGLRGKLTTLKHT
jgi:hypothetical protein